VNTNAIIVTAIDNSGNSNSAVMTVTVEDSIAPTASAVDIVTLHLDASGTASI
jgi:large repetitive protein